MNTHALFSKMSQAPSSELQSLDARLADIKASAMAREVMMLPAECALPIAMAFEKASIFGLSTLRSLASRSGRSAYQQARTHGLGRRVSLGASRLGAQEARLAAKLQKLRRALEAKGADLSALREASKQGRLDPALRKQLRKAEALESNIGRTQKELKSVQKRRAPLRPMTEEEAAVEAMRQQNLESGGATALKQRWQDLSPGMRTGVAGAGALTAGFAGANLLGGRRNDATYEDYPNFRMG